MNELVSTSVRMLQAEGVALRLPDDLADLIELNRLADLVTQATPSSEYLAAVEPELQIGGVTLRRLSLGAVEFMENHVAEWFGEDPDDYLRSLVYCMAEGRDPAALFAYTTATSWRKAVRRWCRQVSVSLPELQAAIARFQRAEKTDDQAAVKSDKGWLLETLLATYGGTVEQWVWKTSLEEIALLVDRLRERRNEEARREAGASGGHASDPELKSMRALYRFRTFEEQLLKRLKERDHGR